MAWRSHGRTNSEVSSSDPLHTTLTLIWQMVDNLRKNGLITSDAVATVRSLLALCTDKLGDEEGGSEKLRREPRVRIRGFSPVSCPVRGTPKRARRIGFNATISAPHMHAHAVENLLPLIASRPGRILDVGSGSGYRASPEAGRPRN